MTKKESGYFFCYNKRVMEYLRHEKNIKFIVSAKAIHTDKIFYLFEQTPELTTALKEIS